VAAAALHPFYTAAVREFREAGRPVVGSGPVGAEGTAAWLELNTGFGHVRNQLENATRPEEAEQTVEVRGRTSYGDITIHRS